MCRARRRCLSRGAAALRILAAWLLGACVPMAFGGGVEITEFLASNHAGLADEDGDRPDWIEIHNGSATLVDVGGWFLTNDRSNLRLWRFPNLVLQPDEFRIVFASGKDRAIPGRPLHAGFKLSSGGGYLGLVSPDGVTVASEFTDIPPQYTDVSYGVGHSIARQSWIGPSSPLQFRVPTGPDLITVPPWQDFLYSDANWSTGTNGVGFERTVAGFAVRWVKAEVAVTNLARADAVLADPALRSDVLFETRPVINYRGAGPNGHYLQDAAFPGGTSPQAHDDFVLEARAWVTIPTPGDWTFGVSSDAGFRLDVGDFTVAFPSLRLAGDSLATFNFPAAGDYPLHLLMFENTGGEEVELFAGPGRRDTWTAEGFRLVGDVAGGGLVARSADAPGPDSLASYRDWIQTPLESAMAGLNASVQLRFAFVYDPALPVGSLRLDARYDDGFVAWLNGTEVARRLAPGVVTWNSSATAGRSRAEGLAPEGIPLTAFGGLVQPGTNLLSIQVLNASPSDPDLLFQAILENRLVTTTTNRFFAHPTPGDYNEGASFARVEPVRFSRPHGFQDTPFDLVLGCDTPGAAIRYTLDGTSPDGAGGLAYTGPLHVERTSIVRAIATLPGFTDSLIAGATYLFLGDILQQSPAGDPPPGWPVSVAVGTRMDYGMDSRVVEDPAYRDEIRADLTSIPSLSVVMDLRDLFDPATGIYANPSQQGKAWERPASIEWMPPGSEGFQAPVGIRIRGGYSRQVGNSKHSFRIFLSPEYGLSQLDYPLFGEDGAASYDKFDLRSMQNDSWHLAGDPGALFLRDPLSRDLQLAMGQPSTHGRFCHVYLNGQYWGLYTTEERPEAAFGAQYLGGRTGDYDVVKIESGGVGISASDGTLTAWSNLWAMAEAGLGTDAAYQKVQGNNPDGSRNPGYPNLLDVPSLVDYMLINIWAGNHDGPWVPNNFFCLRNRNGSDGFRFVVHDSESTLLGLEDDLTGPVQTGAVFAQSNPARLWQRCQLNPEFRVLVGDHVQRHLLGGGALAPDSVLRTFGARVDEIHGAVVGESARWGDAQSPAAPFTRDVEWMSAVRNLRDNYLPRRTAVVVSQLVAAGLYPRIAPPTLSPAGGAVPAGSAVTLGNPGAAGTVLFTVNGPDPRRPGGAIAPEARVYEAPVTLAGESVLRARVRLGNDWSALVEGRFYPEQDFSALVATEIMYNPPGNQDVLGDEYEFLELQNRGAAPLELGGYAFSAGIQFVFPPATILQPGAFFLLARNPGRMADRYPGVAVDGVYTGKLDNGGESLVLNHPLGHVVWTVTYDDGGSWPRTPDGLGFSLVPRDGRWPATEGTDWRASAAPFGSPGREDPPATIPPVLINEIRASSPAPLRDAIELWNPTDAAVDVGGWYLTDDAAVPLKFRIPTGTVIPAGGFRVFDDAQFNPHPGTPPSFGLSVRGEEVFLFSAGPEGGLTGYTHRFNYQASAPGTSIGRLVTSAGEEVFVPMATATFGGANIGPALGPVILNEIHYHPAAGYDEYVELRNLSDSDVPLFDPSHSTNTWRLAGVGFALPAGLVLPPGGLLVVAGIDPGVFRSKYSVPAGVPVLGPFGGALQNDGERLELQRPGTPDSKGVPYWTVDDVRYSDHAPWPPEADGAGPSLQRTEVAELGGEPRGWFASGLTPGRPNHTNQPPVARIVAPSAGTEPVSPADVLIQADVSDPDGSVARVEYFAGGQKLGETTGPPHQFLWRNATGGESFLTVVVTDDGWSLTRSDPVRIGVQPAPPGDGLGLAAEYFDNTNFTALKAVRLDPAVDFHWGTGAPAPGVGAETFSVRWSGQVRARVTGLHEFTTLSDEGVRLWVDGQLVVDNWAPHEEAVNTATLQLEAGRRYDLRMEYYDNTGNAAVSLSWAAPGLAREVIPSSQLYPGARTTPGPFILSQPASQTNIAGNAASMTVYAMGTGVLHYAWIHDGVPVTGAESATLAIAKVSEADAGNYVVRVTDDLGSEESRPARLDLWFRPELVYLPVSIGVLAGDELRLEAVARGTPPLSFRWRQGARLFPAQTNGVLVIPQFKATDAGAYSVTITNVTGLRTNSPSVTVTLLGDADGDRLPDDWERAHGLDPADASDGAGDPDGDGASNREEYLAGTDPRDPASVLKIEPLTVGAGGVIQLRFRTVAHHAYTLLEAGELPAGGAGGWQPVWQGAPAPQDGLQQVTLPGGRGQTRYYRLSTP